MQHGANRVQPDVSLIKKDAATPRNAACTVMVKRDPQPCGEER